MNFCLLIEFELTEHFVTLHNCVKLVITRHTSSNSVIVALNTIDLTRVMNAISPLLFRLLGETRIFHYIRNTITS